MIYKEFKDIVNQVVIILSFLIIIPIIHFTKFSFFLESAKNGNRTNMGYINGNITYFFIFAFIILLLADILGKNLFNRELKDISFEYLLSTPLSKFEILKNKLIPRIIILISVVLVYSLIFNLYFEETVELKSGLYLLIIPRYLFAWVILYFLINVSLSIFKPKNWIALIYLLTIYSLFSLPFAIRTALKSFDMNIKNEVELLGYGFLIGFIIILIILGSGFIIVFRQLDLRDKWFIGNGFSKIIIPVEIIIIIFSVIIMLK